MAEDPKSQLAWQKLSSEFQHKSDRSTAILGGVYLQIHLGQLIEGFAADPQQAKTKLLASGHPLESLSARIETAYALGLVSQHEYHDLIKILKINYFFLNQVDGASFEDSGIREKCYTLKIPRDVQLPVEGQTPRQLFVFATALLAQQIMLRVKQAEQERRVPRDNFMLLDTDR